MEEQIDELEFEFAQKTVDQLEDVYLDQRADEFCMAISSLRDKSSFKEKYVHLPRIMFAVLSVAHSSAEDENFQSGKENLH